MQHIRVEFMSGSLDCRPTCVSSHSSLGLTLQNAEGCDADGIPHSWQRVLPGAWPVIPVEAFEMGSRGEDSVFIGLMRVWV